jgi:ABC-type antimicrobial peptide transport system permease subunit
LEVNAASLLKASGLSLVIAALAALLPIRQISGLDPAVVFRGK